MLSHNPQALEFGPLTGSELLGIVKKGGTNLTTTGNTALPGLIGQRESEWYILQNINHIKIKLL